MKPIQDTRERHANRDEMLKTSSDERELRLIFYLARELDSPENLWSELVNFWKRVAAPADPLRQVHLAGLIARWWAEYRQALSEARLCAARGGRAAAYRRWSELNSTARAEPLHANARSTPGSRSPQFFDASARSAWDERNSERPGSPCFPHPVGPVERARPGAVARWRARHSLDGLVDEACRSLSSTGVEAAQPAIELAGQRPLDRRAGSTGWAPKPP